MSKGKDLLAGIGIASAATAGCSSKLPEVRSNLIKISFNEKENALSPYYAFLSKLTYGPRSEDLKYLRKVGVEHFVEQQLNPESLPDHDCEARIRAAKLHIEYQAGSENGKKWPHRSENRPLVWLDKSSNELWTLVDSQNGLPWEEKVRPAEEIRVATVLRAVYSSRQLEEILTQFWHNHFNINIDKDEKISALLPVYDRDVIRKHCLGNFRQFIEAVATSGSMLYYLDNALSKASPANENYARELFELHTLGAENYLNHLYNRWREVPGAANGRAIGYIDQDVYEAARAFTGWTIADGSDDGKGENFPNTGHFHYYEGWHDNYQKRVLGAEFDPNQAPMADGRRVLDIVAYHPATAYRLCKKLCIRLVSDNPPEELVKRAMDVWLAEKSSPDQIKKVVRTIVTSPEMLGSFGQKVKNPFELVVSFLRTTGADVKPNANLLWALSQMGYRLFNYHAPTGHPDFSDYWLSTNVMVRRWNVVSNLTSDWMEAATFNIAQQVPETVKTSEQIAGYWLNRLLGNVPSSYHKALTAFLAQSGNPHAEPTGDDDDDLVQRLNCMVALIAMLPEFQLR